MNELKQKIDKTIKESYFLFERNENEFYYKCEIKYYNYKITNRLIMRKKKM